MLFARVNHVSAFNTELDLFWVGLGYKPHIAQYFGRMYQERAVEHWAHTIKLLNVRSVIFMISFIITAWNKCPKSRTYLLNTYLINERRWTTLVTFNSRERHKHLFIFISEINQLKYNIV